MLSAFALCSQAGERLGMGVTLVLTTEFSRSALTDTVPICGEILWLEAIILLNLLFTMISMFESCRALAHFAACSCHLGQLPCPRIPSPCAPAVVLGLAYNHEERIFPKTWHKWKRRAMRYLNTHASRVKDANVDPFMTDMGDGMTSVAGMMQRIYKRGAVPPASMVASVKRINPRTGTPRTAALPGDDGDDGNGAPGALREPPIPIRPSMPSTLDQQFESSAAIPAPTQRVTFAEEEVNAVAETELATPGAGASSSIAPPPAAPPPTAPPSPPEPAQLSRDESSFVSSYALNPDLIEGLRNAAPRESISEASGVVPDEPEESATSKLIFFENLFFNLDVDGGNTLTFDEVRRMLAFTALDLGTEEREAALREADMENADGTLDRHEFMDLCVTILWDQPLQQLRDAAANYGEFRAALKRRANTKWRGRADVVDRFSRFWVPATYLTLYVIMINTKLHDHYGVEPGKADAPNAENMQGYEIEYNFDLDPKFFTNELARAGLPPPPQNESHVAKYPMLDFFASVPWAGFQVGLPWWAVLYFLLVSLGVFLYFYTHYSARKDQKHSLLQAQTHSKTVAEFTRSKAANKLVARSATMRNIQCGSMGASESSKIGSTTTPKPSRQASRHPDSP